jgi:hypothetical protein
VLAAVESTAAAARYPPGGPERAIGQAKSKQPDRAIRLFCCDDAANLARAGFSRARQNNHFD